MHETDPKQWGAATSAHTDLRFIGQETENVDRDVENYGYAILDGRANIGNVQGATAAETDILRREVNSFVAEKLKEGYKPAYPKLTEDQLKTATTLSTKLSGTSAYTDMNDINRGLLTIEAAFKDESGFRDIAAINAFQRMVDPGATVRSEDVVLIQSAVAILDKLNPIFQARKIGTGDKLPASVRGEIAKTAQDIYNANARYYNDTTGAQYERLADQANIPFNLIGNKFTEKEEESNFGLIDISNPQAILNEF